MRCSRKHFGDIKIEELAKPYFCVSSDLTTGRDHIHRTGLLWRALRASVALPGILPPVTAEGGHLLVDGGVMNNLPIDVMAQEARGPIIAVDVSGEIDLHADDDKYGERSLFTLIKDRMKGSPSIISILMRAGTVGSNLQRKNVRALADFLYEPPLEGIGMRDWKPSSARSSRAMPTPCSRSRSTVFRSPTAGPPDLRLPSRASRKSLESDPLSLPWACALCCRHVESCC